MSYPDARYTSPIVYYPRSKYDIQRIFTGHQNTIRDSYWNAEKEIHDWRNSLIQQIDNHVHSQKQVLLEIYEKQKKSLDSIYEQFLASFEHLAKDSATEIERLFDKCQNLKVKLVEFNYQSRDIQFIDVVQVDLQKMINPQETTTNETQRYRSEINTTRTNTTSALASTSRDESNRQSTSHTEGSPNRLSSYNATNMVVSDGKCPTCYMIFPTIMSDRERENHINEHYDGFQHN
ncbi:unnamed protein product [Adineta ricciae]|uniref:Uncharacterized protein n=1 Tax=Adineta ricciae TaxID=249248 RepID=A0A815PLX7_ADIRI|nr:unnamed protein product [Adineta ricciae]CAF1450997.1 unnamed protein product [Adineta ricciae]